MRTLSRQAGQLTRRGMIGAFALAVLALAPYSTSAGTSGATTEGLVRIEFATESGIAHFPGLAKPVVIDAADLSAAEATEIGNLISDTDFFERPAPATPRGADYQVHIVTIVKDDRRRTLRIPEPVDDPNLAQLIRFLRAKAKTARPANR